MSIELFLGLLVGSSLSLLGFLEPVAGAIGLEEVHAMGQSVQAGRR